MNSKLTTYLVLGVVAATALYFVSKKLKDAAAAVGAAVNPLSDQNLAYRGVNAVGASVSGDNNFSLGGWIYDWVHPAYDPNAAGFDKNTPHVGNSTVSNPVKSSPSILPYSYKQAVIDTPTLLGTDRLFTPVPGYGSSGTWAESGVPGTAAGPSSPNYRSDPNVAFGTYPSLRLQ